MKPFYASLNAHEIHHLKNLLESAGIRCRLRNEGLATLAGEVPFTECAIQLVLENDADHGVASSVLREMSAIASAVSGTWNCASCGERLEPQFTACWSCGGEK